MDTKKIQPKLITSINLISIHGFVMNIFLNLYENDYFGIKIEVLKSKT
jgi:hypothetical protein